MTDFSDISMAELKRCKFAIIDGDKKDVASYAKKTCFKRDYNLDNFQQYRFSKIWFYKPWLKTPPQIDTRYLYNTRGVSFPQYCWLSDRVLDRQQKSSKKKASSFIEVSE